MGLADIGYGGIRAYCSDLIAGEDNSIYLICIGGYQSAVRGITANVLEKEAVYIIKDGIYEHYQRTEDKYISRYKKMPSELVHGMLLSENGFLVIGEDEISVKQRFFRHLDQNIGTPLHPSWASYLWEVFHERQWLIPLMTVVGNLRGYLICVEEEELTEVITEAIAYQIPEIMRGFRKGDLCAESQTVS
jgi:hypothetical protein